MNMVIQIYGPIHNIILPYVLPIIFSFGFFSGCGWFASLFSKATSSCTGVKLVNNIFFCVFLITIFCSVARFSMATLSVCSIFCTFSYPFVSTISFCFVITSPIFLASTLRIFLNTKYRFINEICFSSCDIYIASL